MASTADLRFCFNRGEIGQASLARVDRDAFRLAAETQENWMPLPQGPMMLRPGTAYLGSVKSNRTTRLVPFVFSRDDTALIELTTGIMRVWVDDEVVSRVSVSTRIVNSSFNSTSGWALNATTGATATISGGSLTLNAAARGSSAKATQTLAVSNTDKVKEHALRIVVTKGPVYFKAGSGASNDNLVHRTALGTGTHSLAFTPNANTIYLTFENLSQAERTVASCAIEGAGKVELPTSWKTSNLDDINFVQSGDVIFVACAGVKPQKIERRSTTSWSVVDYLPSKGPLRLPSHREEDIKVRVLNYEGDTRIVASSPLFHTGYVDAVMRLFPDGQTRAAKLAGQDVWTDPVRITGVEEDRIFSVKVTGTWKGTLRLQRSLDGPTSGFKEAASGGVSSGGKFVKNGTYEVNDSVAQYNNSVVWYRVGFADGGWSSGTATVSFTGDSTTGGITDDSSVKNGGSAGYVRITSVISSTVAEVEITSPVSSTKYTKNWMIQEWNREDDYPTAVTLFDGRLWWASKDRIWGSVSDDYENFDFDFEGDAGPISRSLGSGPVDSIVWFAPLTRLLVGRGTAVSSIRSSNFDEPLTPTNFTIKDASTRGCKATLPGIIDSRGVYIHANGRQLFEVLYRVESQDYAPFDLTQFNLDIGLPGFKRLAVAHSPDVRIFVVRDDGQVAVLLHDSDGQDTLMSWWRIKAANGTIEDIAVLPGLIEDKVYAVVKRSSLRSLEVFARADECIGEPLTKCLDGHVVYSGSAATTLTGLSHLNGYTVAVWGSPNASDATGRYLGKYTVSGGSISKLPVAVTTAVVGLPYSANFLSTKLAYGAGLSIGQIKHIDQIGFVLFNTDAQGLTFGPDLDNLDPMPLVEDGTEVEANKVWDQYDKRMDSLPGKWTVDARLALHARGPRPATVGAVVLSVDTSARVN